MENGGESPGGKIPANDNRQKGEAEDGEEIAPFTGTAHDPYRPLRCYSSGNQSEASIEDRFRLCREHAGQERSGL